MARTVILIAGMLALSLHASGGFYGGGGTKQWEAGGQRYTLTGAGLGYQYRQDRFIYNLSYTNYADQHLATEGAREFWYQAQTLQGSVEYRYPFAERFFAGPWLGVEQERIRWRIVQSGQTQESGSDTETSLPFKECVGVYPDRRSLVKACYEFSSDLGDHADARQGFELSAHLVLARHLSLFGSYYEATKAPGSLDAYRTYGIGVGLSL